jgi:hypothetical protein
MAVCEAVKLGFWSAVEWIARTHLKNVFWPNIFVGASLSRVAGFPV